MLEKYSNFQINLAIKDLWYWKRCKFLHWDLSRWFRENLDLEKQIWWQQACNRNQLVSRTFSLS